MKKTACTLFLSILLATPIAFGQTSGADKTGKPGSSIDNPLPATPSLTRAELANLRKSVDQARFEFHEAMRQYLLSMPDMTAEEEALARAAFLRTNFDWSVEVAMLEEELAEVSVASKETADRDIALAEIDSAVEGMRASARNVVDRREAEAYRRAAAAIIFAEQEANQNPGQ